MEYAHNKNGIITRIYSKEEYEDIIRIAAEMIYYLCDEECPVKSDEKFDYIVDTDVAEDICHQNCPEDKIDCWENYLYNELYWNQEFEDEEDK